MDPDSRRGPGAESCPGEGQPRDGQRGAPTPGVRPFRDSLGSPPWKVRESGKSGLGFPSHKKSFYRSEDGRRNPNSQTHLIPKRFGDSFPNNQKRLLGLKDSARAENAEDGAGGGNRTHGLGIMRPSLYH